MPQQATCVRLPGYRNPGGSGCTYIYAYYGGSIIRYFKSPQNPAYWGSWVPNYTVQCQLYEILIAEALTDTLQRLWDGIVVGSSVGPYGYMAFGEGLESAYLTHPKSAGRTPAGSMTLDECLNPAVGPGTFTGQSASTANTWWDGSFDYPPGTHGSLTNPPNGYFASGQATTLLVGTFIFDTVTGLWEVRAGIEDVDDLNTEFRGLYGDLCGAGNSVSSDIPFISD